MQLITNGEKIDRSERRQLTVMFCDLVDSTRISSLLDPEDYREVLHTYHNTVSTVVNEFNGQVSQYLGDGLRVIFGYPQARENDAERAVRAGLAIINHIKSLQIASLQIKGLDRLKVRIGIATGIVVVGNVFGEGDSGELAVFGDTPNKAARLQALALPDMLVVSGSTKNLLGNVFQLKDLGLQEAKGFSKRIQAWHVLKINSARNRFELIHGGSLTSMVNRSFELDLLEKYSMLAKNTKGQAVFIMGEAGIGKSRIIMEYANSKIKPEYKTFFFQCSPYHLNNSLYPVVSKFQSEITESNNKRTLEQLEDSLSALKNEDICLIPYLQTLLSIEIEDKYRSFLADMHKLKHDAFNALCNLILNLSKNTPLLIVLEDAHWLDPTSLELLALIIDRIKHSNVLLLVTARPEFSNQWLDQDNVKEITVQALDDDSSTDIVKGLVDTAGFSENLLCRILQKADGKPLFIEELVKLTMEGAMNDDVELSSEINTATITIPASLQDSLMSRLDRLGAFRECAQVGAVIGREFSLELIANVMGRSGEEIRHDLTSLIQADIIYKHGIEENVFVFKHALVQDAAYESLLKKNRRYLHARVADVLVSQYPEKVRIEPELLAHHYTEAHMPDFAIQYWTLSASRALHNSAYTELMSNVRKGMSLLNNIEDTTRRERMELDFQILLGTAYRATRGFASNEVEAAFSRAYILAEKLKESKKLIDILRGLFACYYVRAQHNTALEQADLVLVRAGGIPRVTMLGHWMRGCILFWQGNFLEAKDELTNAVQLYDPSIRDEQVLSAQIDPGVNANIHMIWTKWITGEVDSAVELSEYVINHARELKQPFTLSMALWWTCAMYTCRGDFDSARTVCDELLNITSDYNFSYLFHTGRILDGLIHVEMDKTREGEEKINQAWDVLHQQEAFLGKPWSYAILITCYLKSRKYDKAMEMVEAALSNCQKNNENQWLSEIYRLKGQLLLAGDDFTASDAVECFETAINIGKEQGALSLELRSTIALANYLLADNKKRDGIELLRSVYTRFTEGHETRDLLQAKKILDS